MRPGGRGGSGRRLGCAFLFTVLPSTWWPPATAGADGAVAGAGSRSRGAQPAASRACGRLVRGARLRRRCVLGDVGMAVLGRVRRRASISSPSTTCSTRTRCSATSGRATRSGACCSRSAGARRRRRARCCGAASGTHAARRFLARARCIVAGACGPVFAGTLRWVDSDAKNFSAQRRRERSGRQRHVRVLRRESSQRAELRPALRDHSTGEALTWRAHGLRHAQAGGRSSGPTSSAVRRRKRRAERGAGQHREPGRGVSRSYGNPQRPHAESRPPGARKPVVLQRLRHRQSHGARHGGAVARATADPRASRSCAGPNNDKLFSLGSVFEDKDYAVIFAYGGYGYFDNMNAFFDANDYRSIDRARHSAPSA